MVNCRLCAVVGESWMTIKIRGEMEETEVPCFDEKTYRLPDSEELIEARWPKYKDRLARAILLLSLRGGAEDIADGATAGPENALFLISSYTPHGHELIIPVIFIDENDRVIGTDTLNITVQGTDTAAPFIDYFNLYYILYDSFAL